MSGAAGGRYSEYVARLRAAALDGVGALDPALRHAVEARAAGFGGRPDTALPGRAPAQGEPLPATADSPAGRGTRGPAPATFPAELAAFVDKAARLAADVTDDDLAALRRAGFSEDAVFEICVAVAVGAGTARVERGMAALNGEI